MKYLYAGIASFAVLALGGHYDAPWWVTFVSLICIAWATAGKRA